MIVLVRCPGADPHGLFAQLLHAFARRQSDEVQRLIDSGAGLDSDGSLLATRPRDRSAWGRAHASPAQPGNGCTMLHLAIRERMEKLACVVIGRGVELEDRNDCGRTALLQAAVTRQAKVADALLDAGANANATDAQGCSALHLTLRQRADELTARLVHACSVQVRLQAFADTSTILGGTLMDVGGQSSAASAPVLMACLLGMPRTALALVELGSDIEGADEHGRTALHYAHL